MTESEESLLQRPRVSGDESVIRGLHEPYWDPKLRRGTPSAFKGNRKSVNRPAVLSEEAIVEKLREKLETPTRRLEGIATICIDKLIACGASSDCEPTALLSVMEDPEEDDPSHAEIMGTNWGRTELRKISTGLAKKILDACDIKSL